MLTAKTETAVTSYVTDVVHTALDMTTSQVAKLKTEFPNVEELRALPDIEVAALSKSMEQLKANVKMVEMCMLAVRAAAQKATADDIYAPQVKTQTQDLKHSLCRLNICTAEVFNAVVAAYHVDTDPTAKSPLQFPEHEAQAHHPAQDCSDDNIVIENVPATKPKRRRTGRKVL